MYQLTLTDEHKQHLVVLSLPDDLAKHAAADVVFEILGGDVDKLVREGVLAEGQIEEFKTLQSAIFDQDAEGMFIRESISFKANGVDFDPDAPFGRAFKESMRDGVKYMRGELIVYGTNIRPAPSSAGTKGAVTNEPAGNSGSEIRDLSRVMFLHQIAIGYVIDVTQELPELLETIAWAEKNELIEIDVKKVAYKLTERGKRTHDSYIEEAQDLIRRFDIYGNVDCDNSGIYFDTGLGRDLRVPAFELEGVDPFRARFLLGINDGEWDKLTNWPELFTKESWYAEIFAPVENAPSLEEIGDAKMAEIVTKAKTLLRQEQQNLGH